MEAFIILTTIIFFLGSFINNRMHDIGLSGFWLLLLPLLLVFWILIINNLPDFFYYFLSDSPYIARDLIITLSIIFYLPLLMLILCFIPGDKKANKFGPSCGNLRIDAEAKFLVFYTKFLQKLHFIGEVEIVSKNSTENIEEKTEKIDTYKNETIS